MRKREKNSNEIEHKKAKRNKRAEVQELVDSLHTISIIDEADRFYFAVESAIRKAFEVKMNFTEDRVPTKLEILTFCDQQNLLEIKGKVEHVFRVCEQSRFGFGTVENESIQIKKIVSEILDQLS
jgi:hypothetical protein